MTTETVLHRALWRWLLIGGLLTIAIGAVLTFWPEVALNVVGWMVGLHLVVVGAAFLLGRAIGGENVGQILVGVLLGVLGIWVGIVAFRNPGLAVGVLTIVIGAAWFVGGMVELAEGVVDRSLPARGWVALMGILSAVAGLILLFYPAESARTLAVLSGVVMLVLGIARVISALRVKAALGAPVP